MDNTKPHKRPLWLGLLIAPWAAPLGVLIAMVVAENLIDGQPLRINPLIEVGVWLHVLGLPIAYAGTVALGLPIVWALKRHQRLTILNVCLIAVPAGIVAMMACVGMLDFTMPLPTQLLLGGLSALAVAFAFGIVCGIAWRR